MKTIADVLRDAGYATAMVGKWHLGFEGGNQADLDRPLRGGPCDRGFDTFFGLPASLDIPDYYWIVDREVPDPPTVKIEGNQSEGWSPVQGAFWRGGMRGSDFQMEDVLDRIGRESVSRIEALAADEKPFFLHVPLTSPHTPWLPAPEFQSADGAGLYSQFVAHTDAVVGRILAALQRQGVAEQTLVIFSSDNGPVWYPSDTERFGHDSVAGLRGIKGDVWEGGHRVPFIVRWPGRVPAGKVSDQLLSFVDVHATVAELAGASAAESATDSLSFADVWLGNSDEGVRTELVCFQKPIAVRSGRWKLITQLGSAGFLSHRGGNDSAFLDANQDELNPDAPESEAPRGQLYDLQRDRDESNNLWSDRPEIVRRLEKRLDALSQPAGS